MERFPQKRTSSLVDSVLVFYNIVTNINYRSKSLCKQEDDIDSISIFSFHVWSDIFWFSIPEVTAGRKYELSMRVLRKKVRKKKNTCVNSYKSTHKYRALHRLKYKKKSMLEWLVFISLLSFTSFLDWDVLFIPYIHHFLFNLFYKRILLPHEQKNHCIYGISSQVILH
jgi:hypothetical protein